MFKKFLSLFLAVLMVTGMFPITALAAAQPTQSSMSKGVYLAIYKGGTDFPGEPATQSSAAGYTNFNSSFNVVSYSIFSDSGAYVHNATNVISSDILNAITEGADGTWGYVKTSGNGVSDYIIDENIKNRSNVEKMIKAVRGRNTDTTNLDILWYVIKKQSGGGRSDDYWHIDGVIVDRTTYYVSYEGNGATGGKVPSGVNKIAPGTTYEIQEKGSLIREVAGYTSRFVGWCENPDGSTKIYQPGETITVNKNTTFYAIWEDRALHDVTINVYLDNIKAQVGTVHNNASDLYIKTETGSEYIKLSNTGTGVYTTEVSGNGNYYVYHNHNGEWEQITENFITVYNKDASMDINHYSVAYDLGGGSFASGESNKYNAIYSAGKPVSVTSEVPTKTVDGVTYYFNGWRDNNGNVFSAGESVTSAISAPITLSAQWTEPAKAKVNVTIDRNGGGGFDNSDASEEAEFIFRHIHGTATDFPSVSLTPESHNGYTYISNENTNIATYTANNWTYLNLEPSGEYTVYAEKEGYTVTKEVTGSHSEGWVINLGFKYAPEDFTLHYDAVVATGTPKEIYPEAVNVKVTYWGYDVNNVLGWHTISQQLGNGTEKPLYIDPVTGKGTSNYPVWKFWADSTEPYYYRVEVVSFVMPNGEVVDAIGSGGVYNSTNGIYSAVVSIEKGGGVATYPQSSGVPGAYFDTNSVQNGRPTITISANAFDVTFDANGGKVNGNATDTAENVFSIPAFSGYTATRGDGYTFGGWYTDKECTNPAQEGKILSGNTTLYAKWKAPLTITGDVTIHGTYLLGENTIKINPVDKPRRATVILRKAGQSGTVANSLIEFDWGTDFGANSATKGYSFTMLPDDGSTYYIDIKVNNYTTTYRNDGENGTFAADKSTAIFAPNSKTATVDAVLDFTPGSYTQKVVVDATDIAKDFRPKNSISAEILYRNMGSNTVFDVISQHKTPDGKPLSVTLEENGKREVSETIWKQFYDGTAYEYQVRIPSTIEGLPCYVTYGNTAHWNGIEASGTLYAYIKANTYDVTFDYNDNDVTANKTVPNLHKWSHPTEITETPTREGFVFGGWECTTAGVSFDSATATIGAEVHEDVTLEAVWLTDSNKDKIPDIYQKKVNFFVLNGTWENDSIVPKTVWVTLYDANGDWAEDGTGTLADSDIPAGMKPNPGHGNGNWDRTIVKENITADATYTYSFTLRTDIEYVVHYYKVNTTSSLVDDKTGTGTFGETYTETAPAVSGYTVDAASKTVTLSKETGNEITFYYSPRTDLSLTVNYYDYADKGQDAPTAIHPSRTINNVTFGSKISVDALAETITGYTYKPEISEYIVKVSDNVINLYYEKNSYAYKVEYYYDGVLKTTESKSAKYGTEIELDPTVKVVFENKNYALDYTRNNPLTIKEDVSANVIVIYYARDEKGGTNDGIPDKYQALVTYSIVGGTWSEEADDNATKSYLFNLRVKDSTGTWVNASPAPTLGTYSGSVDTVPTGMKPATGYNGATGTWIGAAPAKNTPVTGDAAYTYSYSKSEYALNVAVDGGTVKIGDGEKTSSYHGTYFHDESGKTVINIEPNAGYTLDSVRVGGVEQNISTLKKANGEAEPINREVPHTAGYNIVVVYKPDTNGDNIPDEYQATVTYKIVNGTWTADATDKEPKSYLFNLKTLNDKGEWVATNVTLGTHPVSGDTVPTGMKALADYNENLGTWDKIPTPDTLVKSDAVYIYSYTKLYEHLLIARVTGGTLKVNGETKTSPQNIIVEQDGGTTDFEFNPADADYTLDSIKVNGVAQDISSWKDISATSEAVIMADIPHTADYTVEVVYKPDANGDNTPDEYQATVYFDVVNGTWKEGGSATKTKVYSLKVLDDQNGNVWKNAEAYLLESEFPHEMVPNPGYGRGRWNPPAPAVNGSIEIVGNIRFTHTFVINEYTTSVTIENGTLRIGESTEITSTPYVFEYPHSNTITKYNFAPNPGYTLDTVTVDGTTYSGKNITTSEFRDYVDFAHTNNHSVVVVYSIDGNGDKIPDRYQRRVTFDIINGYWNNSPEKPMAPIVKWVTLFDASGNWSETGTGKLPANEIPSGMVPFAYYNSTSGKWDKVMPKDADGNLVVTAAAAYTFKYSTKLQYTVTIEVVNGTSFPAPSVSTFDQDGDSTTITFTPDSGFIFESVEVNGTISNTPITAYTYNHVSNTHIKVVYTKDTVGGGTDGNEGDQIPDKYQQKVVYKIKNGTWDDNSTADKFEWVELYKNGENGVLAIDGTGTSAVPSGMKAAQHYDVNRGSWTPVIDKNVTSVTVQKTADGSEKVYTYDFVRFEYGTTEVPYTVNHYLQNVDGTYPDLETPSEVVTGKVVLNTTDGKINTEHNVTEVTGTAKKYAHFLAGTSVAPGNSVTPIDLETVEKTISISSDRLTASFEPIRFYYARDRHTVSYDYNTDVDDVEIFEADKTYSDIICGSKVKTEGIPARRGYIFKGWEDIESGVVYKAESDITVNKDYRLKAKWERQTGIEYTVNFLEENTGKVLAESIKGTAAFGDTIFASTYYDGKEIAGYTHIGQNKEQLVIDVGSGANVINIYYSKDVIGGGNNYDEGDDIADKYQVTVEYKVSPEENGKVSFEKEVLTIRNADGKPAMRGTVTISGSEVTPNKGWTLLSWNGTDNSAVETVDANGNKNVLAAKEIEVVGGSTYTFTAVLVPETTEVEPSGAVYKVEHYKWNTETGSYELSETEMLMGEIGKPVTALGKDYEGFCVNENAAGHKPSGTVTLPVLEDGEIKDLLVLKLYYDIDVIGEEGEEPDEIPDIYQKKVTFRVRNGYWARKAKATNDIYDEIVVYLTLRDENGNLSTEGTAKLVVPTGMTPDRGYGRGRWLKNPPEYVSGTNHEIYTYMFYPLNSGKPQDIVVIPEREETEINPGTGAPILG